MVLKSLTPKGMVKKVVGDSFTVKLKLNPKYKYEVELHAPLTKSDKVFEFEKFKKHYQCSLMLQKSGFFRWQVRFRKKGTKRWHWLTDSKKRKFQGELQVDPAWINEAMVYSVFVRFFKGKVKDEVIRRPAAKEISDQKPEEIRQKKVAEEADILPGEGGTFDDVKAHLETLQKMHINTLYFNPIHVIGEMYRGYNMMDQLPAYLQPGSPYSIKDYKSIDPELTYDKDTKKHLLSDPQQEFRDLVEAAHERGMFIIMDLVFNHTAHDFVFQRIRPEWYLYKEQINSLDDPYLYPEDVKQGKPWGDPKHTFAPHDHGVWWEDCAQLNWEYMLPEAANDPPPNYSIREMYEYFYSIPKYWINRFGIDGFRCDVAYRVPPKFWKSCISQAREEAKRAKKNRAHDVVFIAESYTSHLEELQKAGFSAVYGDYSHKLSNPLQLKGYLDYIYNISGKHFPTGSKWFNFPDSHDFDRAPRKVLGDDAWQTDTALIANQSRWLLTATLPGVPLIFNGFEKIEWQPINIWSYGAIDWEKDADLKEYIAQINRIRKQLPALKRGSYTFLETNQGLHEGAQLFAFMRTFKEMKVIVIVNMDVRNQAGPANIRLSEEFSGKYALYDWISKERFERLGRDLTVILKPGQGHIFEVE